MRAASVMGTMATNCLVQDIRECVAIRHALSQFRLQTLQRMFALHKNPSVASFRRM